MSILSLLWQAILTAAGMAWQVMWSLVLGFLISGMIQAYVSRAGMSKVLGRAGFKEIALATGFGAASSSCSYAAIAAAKSMFKRGAALIPVLAFMFASTNLVIELGLILWQLMGWQFALAEWLGGVVLVALVALIVKLTYPKKLVEEGRNFQEQGNAMSMDHGDELAPGRTLWEKARSRQGWVYVAHYIAMDWSMLWKDMVIGFLIAGFLGVLVPNTFWNALFIKAAPTPVQVVENAIVGPIIAVISFVCSIGNVPLAAILFAGGITFGGAIAFIYADLIVLPIIDIYRKYYGWRLAAYITGVLFVTMVLTAIIIDTLFSGLDRLFPAVHFIPTANPHFLMHMEMSAFSFDYTAVLNILSLVVIAFLVYLNVKHPMMMHMDHSTHHGHDMAAMGEAEHHGHDMAAMSEAEHHELIGHTIDQNKHTVKQNVKGANTMKYRLFLFGGILALLVILLAVYGAVGGRNSAQQVQVTETDFHIASSVTTFSPGTPYHFVITNNGRTGHEFMIMPTGMGSMSGTSMGNMDAMALAKVENIAPGQTVTLDYTFPSSTTGSHFVFGCYYPGHYEAGMKQDVMVKAS